jgi:hypothetical protein
MSTTLIASIASRKPAAARNQIGPPGLDRLDRGSEGQHQGGQRQDSPACASQSGPVRPAQRNRKP